jgi:hypothetical protein
MVQRPSFTGLGKRPERTPFHQQLFFTGISAGIGGFALGFPIMCDSRRKPVVGKFMLVTPRKAVIGQQLENNDLWSVAQRNSSDFWGVSFRKSGKAGRVEA